MIRDNEPACTRRIARVRAEIGAQVARVTAAAPETLWVASHSGGKDSQAMAILLAEVVRTEDVVFMHAPLGRVEWPGTVALIRATTPPDTHLILAYPANRADLLERVEARGQFPDPKRRWCTSDLKRTPIEREIRALLNAAPHRNGHVVSCMGHRGAESAFRERAPVWKYNARNSRAGRTWHDYYPVHALSRGDVFAIIATAGQRPHWAYARGMRRLSCSFCIYATPADHATAARLRPDLYESYLATERQTGHTLSPDGRPLDVVVETARATGSERFSNPMHVEPA